jgi:hypothetical protein
MTCAGHRCWPIDHTNPRIAEPTLCPSRRGTARHRSRLLLGRTAQRRTPRTTTRAPAETQTFIGKHHDRQSRAGCPRTTCHSVGRHFSYRCARLDFTRSSANFMVYIITGTDSAGALSLKRDSAAAAIKKAVELIGDGCRDVCITDPDGRIYNHADFDQLRAAERA